MTDIHGSRSGGEEQPATVLPTTLTASGVAPQEQQRPSGVSAYPDLLRAAVDGPADFSHLVQAWSLNVQTGDQGMRDIALWLYPRIRTQLENRYGMIRKQYLAHHVVGGCAITEHGQVFTTLNTDDPKLVGLEIRCKILARDARRVFADAAQHDQRDEATDHIYSALTRVVSAADDLADEAVDAEATARALATATSEVEAASQRVLQLIQRQARFRYFLGVLAGAPVALAVTGLLSWAMSAWWEAYLAPASFAAATVFGALGAVVSVIQRMSNGSLILDYRASDIQKLLLGGLRPLVGSVFGAIVQFGFLAGLFATEGTSTDEAASFGFFAVVGFASGFSERFATDMVERAGKLMADAD